MNIPGCTFRKRPRSWWRISPPIPPSGAGFRETSPRPWKCWAARARKLSATAAPRISGVHMRPWPATSGGWRTTTPLTLSLRARTASSIVCTLRPSLTPGAGYILGAMSQRPPAASPPLSRCARAS